MQRQRTSVDKATVFYRLPGYNLHPRWNQVVEKYKGTVKWFSIRAALYGDGAPRGGTAIVNW